jgi:aspartate-semialdehyde dehydrogenase
LLTQAIDSFDFKAQHIIFVCDKKIIPLLQRHKRNRRNWWIDCTHSITKAVCVIPNINGSILKSHPQWICNPCSNVIALTQVLNPILYTYKVQSIQLVLLMGTLFQGQEATDIMIKQIRHCLIQTPLRNQKKYPQFAFNLLPDYFENFSKIMERQLHCFIDLPILTRTCFVPVVRGCCIHVQLEINKNNSLTKLMQEWSSIPDIHVLQNKQPIGLNELISEEKIFILQPVIQNKILSFWCLQDIVQQGIGKNAALLTQYIQKMKA